MTSGEGESEWAAIEIPHSFEGGVWVCGRQGERGGGGGLKTGRMN